MYGFTCRKDDGRICFEHKELNFFMYVYSDGAGMFRTSESFNVHIPTVSEVNLGGFPNPKIWDNIRHDMVHILYCYLTRNCLSPNHQRLLTLADTPLYECHWEEYKVESLEIFYLTGYKRESSIPCYMQAKMFIDWMMSCLSN